VALNGLEGDAPWLSYTKDGVEQRIDADFIAGCDGFHGPSRKSIPAPLVREFERENRLAGSVFSRMCRPAIQN
jgi:p-hydroxybenzoate 3-monooxygenase